MPSRISICIFACVNLLVVQNSVAKSLRPKCDYACKDQDLETGDGYFASGSAISSQFLAPDGSVVTNSKETSISSDGIKQTFHELKKEADRFIQTGQGGPNIHGAQLPPVPLGNIALPNFQQIQVPYADSYSSQSTKDHGLEKKLIYSLSPSVNSQYTQVQTQNSAHVHSNPQIICDICASHTGSGHLENTASYNTIVGNVLPSSEVQSSYQKSESSSSQKNSSYQAPPFSNLKPNTFTTTYIDFNGANKNTINNGAGSENHVSYQERGSGQIKSEERIQHTYGSGPVAYPSRVVVSVEPSVANSHSYEKQQSSSHVQTANHPVVFPASTLTQQAEAELSKQHQSNVFLPARGVSVDLNQHPSSYQSSHSYYSSSSSSSSKSVSSSDGASPVVIHQNPVKYSASNGYSSSSSSSSSSGSSFSQNNPSEVHIDGQKIHGVSSSIYNHGARGDLQSNPNAETLCTICAPVPNGSPVKKTYGVATSYSSQSSTINGKTTENREAAVEVNDNGKIDSYRVKT